MYNYYAILGIEMDADDRAIKSAYKQLALAYHPDRNPNDPDAEERFKQINEAYQVLSNPSTRERYDQLIWWALQRSAVADEETGAEQQQDQQQAPRGYTSSSTVPPEWHFQDESALSPRERRQRARKQAKAKYNGFDAKAAKAKKAEELEKDDEKGAWIAIGGMAILLVLASVVVNLYDFITERERSTAVAEFRARMQQANESKDYLQSKRLVIDLMEAKNTTSNLPIYELLTELQANIRRTSNELFQAKEYEKALPFHYLWQQEIPGDSLFIESNLLECYMALNRPTPAQELIERMMQRKATRILGYYAMAKLHDSQPDDGSQSRAYQYYDSTARLIINDYISAHGKAYAILLEPKIQPDFHYDVFCDKARMHFKRKEYQKAESAAFWATFLKDDRPEAYIILAQAMDARGAGKQEVCAEMEKGAKYGGEEAEKWMRDRCR